MHSSFICRRIHQTIGRPCSRPSSRLFNTPYFLSFIYHPPSTHIQSRNASSQSKQSSKQTIKPVKGFHDIFHPLSSRYTSVENQLIEVSQQSAYQEVRLPLVEESRLYQRSINESEIVRKELFSFDDQSSNQRDSDKSAHSVSLRPEGTSGLVRALINNQLVNQTNSDVMRYFYTGPMFRRERPQKGRTRQFTQFGIECINDPSINADIECIDAAYQCLLKLDVAHACTLHINSLGDDESRANYQRALSDWLNVRKELLSQDSRSRLESGNVLRILDTKDTNDQLLITGRPNDHQKRHLQSIIDASKHSSTGQESNHTSNQSINSHTTSINQHATLSVNEPAPLLRDYLNQSSRNRFASLQSGLTDLGISFVVDPYLVRGLDYYNHSAFEFKTHAIHQTYNASKDQQSTSAANYASQSTVLAGGRYDGLFSVLGGHKTAAVGWAAGVDRLILLQDSLTANISIPKPKTFAVIAVREKDVVVHPDLLSPLDASVMKLTSLLRKNGFHVVHWLEKSKLAKQLAQASKAGVDACVILGKSELDRGVLQVKWMQTAEQIEMRSDDLVKHLESSVQ